ncbi:alpha/beta fold hydrolase [Rhodobacter sp. ETT8]|uniref:Alpha/beta fold hydrolase n=2 Tax=Pseudotabrizicola algicola TaxID=2709381 RepID=A0A6B3RTJ9_9RHOB|nr:alpha/beta fold hydrolase [Pseudotabrizicola algicola]
MWARWPDPSICRVTFCDPRRQIFVHLLCRHRLTEAWEASIGEHIVLDLGRVVLKPIKLALVLCLLAACAPRGQMAYAPEAAQVGTERQIFVATTRGIDENGSYNTRRVEAVSFSRIGVSIPPERTAGEINWPPRSGRIDPKTQFLTTSAGRYQSSDDFRAALAKDLRANGGEAVVFVHGFNNTFSEGVYRIAQMAHDLDLPGAVVHYSWPSAAQPLGYVYDRDSALFSRDGLERLLVEIEGAGAKRIVVVAHSMGSALVMEGLRQIAIRKENRILDRIGGVILISPDIDVDVFRAQALAIPKLPEPFIVFSSERDRILRLSATLTGQRDRLGTLKDISRVGDLPITFLDTAAFSSGAGHFNLGDSPSLLRLLDGILSVDASLDAERVRRTGLLPGAVLTVQNATQIILSPVVAIGNELQR